MSPTVIDAHVCRNEVTDECSDVNSHIENVVTRIFFILHVICTVQITNKGRDVWFKESISKDDQHQGHVKRSFVVNR